MAVGVTHSHLVCLTIQLIVGDIGLDDAVVEVISNIGLTLNTRSLENVDSDVRPINQPELASRVPPVNSDQVTERPST